MAGLSAIAVAVMVIRSSTHRRGSLHRSQSYDHHQGGKTVSIAFIGNSMLYFNDFPRFFVELSSSRHHVVQNSCLHGGASIVSLLLEGNGMYPQFMTNQSVVTTVHEDHIIYDYGACTVPQLLLGKDERLDDPGYAQPENKTNVTLNPCREDPYYLAYAKKAFAPPSSAYHTVPQWDFVLINDNTMNPARKKTRAHSLQFLEHFYVPWLLELGSTPIFLWTHAYGNNTGRALPGLDNVANFTSLTYAGYKAYAELLALYLSEEQRPRIAPVGLAFLLVYEENPALWEELFHSDHLHASPSGTLLQGCIIHHTIFGTLPDVDYVFQNPENFSWLWQHARMMQHAWEPPNPFPNYTTAQYLYQVAERISVKKELPKTFIDYQNGEVAHEAAAAAEPAQNESDNNNTNSNNTNG